MELLFNSTYELKEYLPYIDSDLTFENIQLDAEIATKAVVKLIGKKLYASILAMNTNDREEYLHIIKATAYPIAVDAYRNYVINNDVAHTNEGRRIRVSDNEKQAFEWQIDRDNKNLEKRYYRALDNLIEVLDEFNPVIESIDQVDVKWKDSDEYKKTFSPLFRTTEEFNQYFEIESRYLLLKLTPGIKKCITEEIIPRVTSEKWDNYISSLENPSEDKLLNHIKAACAYYALAWASTRFSATIFPEGILQNFVADNQTSQAKKVPDTNQVGVLKTVFEKDYKSELLRIEQLMKPKPIPSANPSYEMEIDLDPNDKIIDI
ncbi:MAG: hypothetical protein KBT36_08750 [Kurthia sp.]|nr:hypothetical protein [Candidatus Kurthia equi]